ncbi:MFS transporter [Paraburkholderia monticola]|nr:MFS transporter [Paraburkholderia monticola]
MNLKEAPQPIRRVLFFCIVAMALMMMAIDSTIVATALHALQHDLNASINWAAWTMTAYSFGFVLMLPVTGKLSEQYGRRRVFLWSVSAFTIASLLCGLANNIYVLVFLRALQAAGGAGFTPSATGLIIDYFGDVRDRAVSLFGSIFPIGALIGPIFGGLFVTYWSWRGIFFVNVPIGLASILLARRFIPADPIVRRPDTSRPGLDCPGMALLGVGLFAAMLAVSILGESGISPWSVSFVACVVVAAVALWLFARHIHRTASPFIDPMLIHGPNFGVVNGVNVIYGGMRAGIVALLPLYASSRYGIGALASGTLLVAQGVATIALSLIAALALRRTGHRLPVYVGGTVMGIGVALLAAHPMGGFSAYTWLAGAAFLIGAGGGGLNPATRNAGLQLAPQSSSTLASIRTMSLQVGQITTVSVVTAILTRVSNPSHTQALLYVLSALIFVAALALVGRIPEHKGAW